MLQRSVKAEDAAIVRRNRASGKKNLYTVEAIKIDNKGQLRWLFAAMVLFCILLLVAGSFINTASGSGGDGLNRQEALGTPEDQVKYRKACPDYRHYAVIAQYAL